MVVLHRSFDQYAWWLEESGKAKEELHVWIAEDENYSEATGRATEFGDSMEELVTALGERAELTRYLLV